MVLLQLQEAPAGHQEARPLEGKENAVDLDLPRGAHVHSSVQIGGVVLLFRVNA